MRIVELVPLLELRNKLFLLLLEIILGKAIIETLVYDLGYNFEK
jgi:hypothetical protein